MWGTTPAAYYGYKGGYAPGYSLPQPRANWAPPWAVTESPAKRPRMVPPQHMASKGLPQKGGFQARPAASWSSTAQPKSGSSYQLYGAGHCGGGVGKGPNTVFQPKALRGPSKVEKGMIVEFDGGRRGVVDSLFGDLDEFWLRDEKTGAFVLDQGAGGDVGDVRSFGLAELTLTGEWSRSVDVVEAVAVPEEIASDFLGDQGQQQLSALQSLVNVYLQLELPSDRTGATQVSVGPGYPPDVKAGVTTVASELQNLLSAKLTQQAASGGFGGCGVSAANAEAEAPPLRGFPRLGVSGPAEDEEDWAAWAINNNQASDRQGPGRPSSARRPMTPPRKGNTDAAATGFAPPRAKTSPKTGLFSPARGLKGGGTANGEEVAIPRPKTALPLPKLGGYDAAPPPRAKMTAMAPWRHDGAGIEAAPPPSKAAPLGPPRMHGGGAEAGVEVGEEPKATPASSREEDADGEDSAYKRGYEAARRALLQEMAEQKPVKAAETAAKASAPTDGAGDASAGEAAGPPPTDDSTTGVGMEAEQAEEPKKDDVDVQLAQLLQQANEELRVFNGVGTTEGSAGETGTGSVEGDASGAGAGAAVPAAAPATEQTVPAADASKPATERTVLDWAVNQDEFAHLPKLLEGWIRIRSNSSGKVYCLNTNTGNTSYVEPREETASAATGSMPEGWQEMTSRSNGSVYYWHSATGRTQLQKPTL